MIWLFLPPQKRHHIPLGNNRVEAAYQYGVFAGICKKPQACDQQT
jgi:hypothetical protein